MVVVISNDNLASRGMVSEVGTYSRILIIFVSPLLSLESWRVSDKIIDDNWYI